MFVFNPHGEYLRAPWATRLTQINNEEAINFLSRSVYVQRVTHDQGPEKPLLNKGWCLVEFRNGCAFLVYNHDGQYFLYTAPAEAPELSFITHRAH